MNVYSNTMFDPQDATLAEERKRNQKKRIYAKSRPVMKSIAFLDSSFLHDKRVSSPNSRHIQKLIDSGNVNALLCNRAWDSQRTRNEILKIAPVNFNDIYILRTDSINLKSGLIACPEMCSMSEILEMYRHGKYVYVLQVGQYPIPANYVSHECMPFQSI